MSPSEIALLTEAETVIERGLGTFVEVGQALSRIRTGRLYRDTHKTFEAYCRDRWRWSKSHANRQIQAAEIAEALTPYGVKVQNEAQARVLAALPPEEQREVVAGLDLEEVPAPELKKLIVARGKKGKTMKMASWQQGTAARANQSRLARIALLKRVCCQLAALPQPVSQADFRKTSAPKGNGMISECAIFPWFHVEVVMVPDSPRCVYHCSIDEDLKAICDACSPATGSLESPVDFFLRLHAELRKRREQLDAAHRGRKWDLDKVYKLDLLNLFDWFERELSTYGKSVLTGREDAARKLRLIEHKEKTA